MDFDPRTYSTLDDLRAGRWYLPVSEEVAGRHREVAELLKEFNDLGTTDPERGEELLRQIMPDSPHVPETFGPLFLEYGHVRFGEGCFLNTQTVLLDVADITVGARTLVGPGCQFITVGHPVNDLEMRRGGWEQAHPITVGEDCWFGAGVIVLPGVTIGDRCILAAGTLVTRDVPDDSLVMGSPGRVVRQLNTGDERLEREDLPDGVPVEGLNV
ncbi:sugar O-acetyltransferase [Corynebacterium testudinoris]|uniref:sugar O-acetyltransferase n=1 Tax=Corynebacterium testudinoris TaxID=136857 RepID=UPI001C8B4CF9|nr:sugar O-acetyltransferase [Corynebacterium testudinoris]MBX8996891.1 sugar O-acetyltransferase [Corynebacterium testudinoris]